ncbi:MAG TPA: hypothetical protein VN706_00260 [Gemmatimonadaceae bacterium]|nr:hypothetical protein [Gemmatimonadaceae bacterium]
MSGRRVATASAAVTAGFLGGLVLGAVVWSTQIRRSRRELFSPRPLKRLAALGHLAGQPGLDSARILTDYLGWEREPALRRRAERLLRRMQARLDAHGL